MKVFVHGDKLDLADELLEEFHADAKGAVGEAADILLGAVRANLQRGGDGPSVGKGDLLKSMKRIAPSVKGAVASSGIRSNDPGANRVEYGAVDVRGIRTLPHPYVRPAMASTEPQIDALLRERLT
jgi:hypothetical protein